MNYLEVFNELRNQIKEFVNPSLEIKVSTHEDAQKAIDTGKVIKDFQKKIDTRRRELVDPLNAQVKKINEYAKQISDPIKNSEAHIQQVLSVFAMEQEKIKQARLKEIEEERRKKQEELVKKQESEKEVMNAAVELFGEIDKTVIEDKHKIEIAQVKSQAEQDMWDAKQQQIKNTRKTMNVKVLNIDLVPKEFLIISLNEKMALAAYKGGKKEIPGLEFYETVSVPLGRNTYVPKTGFIWDNPSGLNGN